MNDTCCMWEVLILTHSHTHIGMGVDIVTDREDVLAAKEDKRLAHLAELASRTTTQADRKQKKKKRKRK
jgi:hypothetical protein